MSCFRALFVSILILLQDARCLNPGVRSDEVVWVIACQEEQHHVSLAEQLATSVLQQASFLSDVEPVIHLTHRDVPHHGSWTYLPIITRLSELHGSNSSWLFFCQERTRIHLPRLLEVLSQYDATQEVWVGRELEDDEATIIHHFSDAPHFRYPLLEVGFAVSTALLNSLASRLTDRSLPESDFAIDSAYELAQFILDSGRGSKLSHSPLLCLQQQPNCASYYLPFKPCKAPVKNKLIHFAVKTCKKFHGDRVPVVQETWARDAKNLAFYSDHRDDEIPTTDLGVPNTIRGHCGKTLAIIRHVAKTYRAVKWLVIADDDTLLSVARLQDLLSCYSLAKPVAIGERYGYNVGHRLGYNYITGGGGIVLNMAAVLLLARDCHCPTDSSPDDMYLGVCMSRLGIPVVHSGQFHQARPPDYAAEVLAVQPPISFHKHWMIDPQLVYAQWFEVSSISPAHSEL